MILGFGRFALGRCNSYVALTCNTCSYRYTSSVRYDSDRHFIQDVTLQPKGLGLEMCSQTVLALPQSTWRHYKTQLEFQPRQRVQRYQSTTIVYPKHTRTFYTTQLKYDGHKLTKRFFSAVEMQASDCQAGF
ncbi:filamin-interacting protein FAM101B-like [Sinocyclocheilus rhinocerous]|uniref:filamin-interacting protein FAM101B-like n=1 Tax=Sinocyclocheilus rhinocerous TaxID=307959 RepID=UPI0007B99179|nr:PREDICTED: filamin-interacting protein FAM101B-like [Sinocyclocheilus rhinocerous]